MPSSSMIPQASDIEDVETVLSDINGNICAPIDRSLLKYFPDCEEESSKSRARQSIPEHEDFPDWFVNFFALESGSARGGWNFSGQAILGPGNETGVHLFLSLPSEPDADADRQWSRVQVVGEFCSGSISYPCGFLSLCALARQVFARQPTRLFLHGFYIHQSTIELWVFDRSGVYGSVGFDIRDRSALFIEIVRRYGSMSGEQLGRSGIMQSDRLGNYITLEEADEVSPRKIYLAARPVTNRRDLVGGGTTCYLAKDSQSDGWKYAVKFKWRLTYAEPENVMLDLIKEKSVRNVVSLVHHKEMETIAGLRSGLRFDLTREFLESGTRQTQNERQVPQGIATHTQQTRDRFQNRTFTCVVTAPVGRPLYTFQTATELVQALRDAVIAHRSLLQDAQVLHQDVSEGNILIGAVRGGEGESTGILLDYDVAIRLADQTEDSYSIAGTTLFMAIGVLRGVTHTYRHDLESFLYVLLRAVITSHDDSGNLPESSRLVAWTGGDYDGNAEAKTEDMAEGNFRLILDEFPPGLQNLRPLAERLRGLLFPFRDGAIYTGTDRSPEAIDNLYDGFIGALGSAIVGLGQV